MLVYNINAFVSAIGGVVAALASGSFGMSQPFSVFFGLAAAAATDLYMRYNSKDVENAIWHPDAGGHLWFIPMWICSVVGAGLAIAIYTGLIK